MPSDEQNQIGANNRRRRVLRKMLYLRGGVAYFATAFKAGVLRLFFKAATGCCARIADTGMCRPIRRLKNNPELQC